jgi:hypothetical protein
LRAIGWVKRIDCPDNAEQNDDNFSAVFSHV